MSHVDPNQVKAIATLIGLYLTLSFLSYWPIKWLSRATEGRIRASRALHIVLALISGGLEFYALLRLFLWVVFAGQDPD